MGQIVPAETSEIERSSDTSSAMVEAASNRQIAEVQAAMAIARRFPRDEDISYARIMRACKRKSLAEKAVYTYPRGGQTVSGPSIRLAEVLAQSWGNIDFGIVEIEQRFDESTMMAYCVDLETNTRQVKIFQVRHVRHTKKGEYRLTDPRDVYELVANYGARRLRSCILGIIPGDITEAAVDQCRKTLSGGAESKPRADRIRDMVAAFAELGVTKDQIEVFAEMPTASLSDQNIIDLGEIYRSIRNKDTKITDWFRTDRPKPKSLDDVVDAEEGNEKTKKERKK